MDLLIQSALRLVMYVQYMSLAVSCTDISPTGFKYTVTLKKFLDQNKMRHFTRYTVRFCTTLRMEEGESRSLKRELYLYNRILFLVLLRWYLKFYKILGDQLFFTIHLLHVKIKKKS